MMKRYRNKRFREKIEKRRAAGRRGGLRSQEVQREKRLRAHDGVPVWPVSPRWSIGVRDNWANEEGWFTWKSWRDTLLRLRMAMQLVPVVKRGRRSKV
jgi:hypothetical protein